MFASIWFFGDLPYKIKSWQPCGRLVRDGRCSMDFLFIMNIFDNNLCEMNWFVSFSLDIISDDFIFVTHDLLNCRPYFTVHHKGCESNCHQFWYFNQWVISRGLSEATKMPALYWKWVDAWQVFQHLINVSCYTLDGITWRSKVACVGPTGQNPTNDIADYCCWRRQKEHSQLIECG